MSTHPQHISGQGLPARSRTDRASWAEYQRLLTAGVNPTTAAVLATGLPPRPDDERAYWRQLARGLPTTPETCAAHAAVQRQRRSARTSSRRRS
jgi:hypothetical protein